MRFACKGSDPYCIMGLSIAWAIFLFPSIYQGFLITGNPGLFSTTNLVVNLGGLTGAGLTVLAARRLSKTPAIPLIIGGFLFALGNFFVFATVTFGALPENAIYAISFLEGFGCATVLLAWMQMTAFVGGQGFARSLAVSMLVGSLLLGFLSAVARASQPLWVTLVLLAAIASFGFFVRVKRRRSIDFAKESQPDSKEQLYPVPIPLEIAMLSVGAAFSIALQLTEKPELSVFGIIEILPIGSAGLAIYLLLRAPKGLDDRISLLCKLAFPLMMFGLLLYLAWSSQLVYVSNFFILLGFFSFSAGVFILLHQISCYRKVSTVYVFSIGLTVLYFGFCLGGILSAGITRLETMLSGNFDQSMLLFALILGLVMILMVLGFFVFDGKKISTLWGTRPHDQRQELREGALSMAEQYGLTQRQTEVLTLLCEGSSVKQIEKTLVVSNGTARAHVRGIYEKCNVHSYAELMKKVQGF